MPQIVEPTARQESMFTENVDLGVAIRAALAGAAVGRAHFGRFDTLEVRSKADGSPVSDADVAVETAVRKVLLAAHPDDAVLGEETGESEHRSHREWVLDGIDGTAAFINGDNRWQSLVALEIDGVAEIGVAVIPEHREIWFAQRGIGAFRQGCDDDGLVGEPQRLAVADTGPMDRVALLPTIDYLSAIERARVVPLIDSTTLIDPTRHGALLVADGSLDVCVELDGERWDYAALRVIVEEAGGAFACKPSPSSETSRTGVFSTNPTVGQSMLDQIDPDQADFVAPDTGPTASAAAAPVSPYDVARIVETMHSSFAAGLTRSEEWRRSQLDALEAMLRNHADRFVNALNDDLGKPASESWMTEIGFALSDIAYQRSQLRGWMKPRRAPVPIAFQPATAKVVPEPKGVVLVIAPWNYPLQLAVSPMAAAISAGNAVVVKPSEVASSTAAVLAELVPQYLDQRCITVVTGGVDVATELLEQRFDHILFTGGEQVGKVVMRAAAEHLTPVTLELGGKSPAIIAHDADTNVAAYRLAWGKFLNAGQTCIAPDYALVERSAVGPLVEQLAVVLREFYGSDPSRSPDYGRIINRAHTKRLAQLLSDPRSGTVVVGGEVDEAHQFVAPTILVDTEPDADVMAEEIFGPILPIIAVDDIADAIDFVNARPKPLALYAFSGSDQTTNRIVAETSSGGVSINDTLLHRGPHELPFGGIGASGMGAYHGQTGFDTFSHLKSVYTKKTFPHTKLIYPPYSQVKDRLVRMVQ